MTTAQEQKTAWIAVDWGTTHMRLWRMGADGTVLDCHASDQGMGQITSAEYEGILVSILAKDLSTEDALDVVICGMAGSRQGWSEAPYVSVPCAPGDARSATQVQTRDTRLRVHILPGVKQMDPADVMRGEETQISGVMAQTPDFTGVICLPGTHTKWARVEQGQIREFATLMSGELFTVIGQHSVLRHSVADEGWDQPAFDQACREAAEDPAVLMRSLFSLRAQSLLADLAPEAARSRLSGLLLGAELAAARSYWQGAEVAIVGASALAQAYAAALKLQGQDARVIDGEQTTLDGLRAAYAQLQET